jgi:hypothetical protein
MFYRDNRKRKKGRKASASSTVMRNKTKVVCSDIM